MLLACGMWFCALHLTSIASFTSRLTRDNELFLLLSAVPCQRYGSFTGCSALIYAAAHPSESFESECEQQIGIYACVYVYVCLTLQRHLKYM